MLERFPSVIFFRISFPSYSIKVVALSTFVIDDGLHFVEVVTTRNWVLGDELDVRWRYVALQESASLICQNIGIAFVLTVNGERSFISWIRLRFTVDIRDHDLTTGWEVRNDAILIVEFSLLCLIYGFRSFADSWDHYRVHLL